MAAAPRLLPRRPRQEDLEGVVLAGADLRAVVLAGLDLRGRDLSGADLSGADLAGAKLQGATLDRALLDDADLAGADLSDCRLHAASFRRTRGGGCVLAGARGAKLDLTGASLVGADLRGVQLEGLLAAEALLQEIDARGANLRGMVAPYAALDQARLDGADLGGADLRRATLEGAGLDEANLERANLDRAKLSGARLNKARLAQATLIGANLRRAEVAGALLDGVSARGLSARGVAWSDAQIAALNAGGARTGPGIWVRAGGALWRWVAGGGPLRVVLAVATGVGWPLRAVWALLSGFGRGLSALRAEAAERARHRANAVAARRAALLSEARGEAPDSADPGPLVLPDPTLQERIVAARTRLLTALREGGSRGLRGALSAARAALGRVGQGVDRERLAPGVDLSGMDLRGEDLSGLDLSGARLRGASLESANLRGTILRGAVLDGARLNWARLDGADLEGASAIETFFDEVSFEGANLVGLRAAGARLVRATFVGARMAGTSLVAADLTGASFADVDLADTNLSGALMEQADLAGARLGAAVVRGAELGAALGLTAIDLEDLRRRGADVGVFSAGMLSLRRLRELLPRVPGITLAVLRAVGSAPPALVRASARGFLSLARGLHRAGTALRAAAVAVQSGGASALGPLFSEGMTRLLVFCVRLPRTFVRAAERGVQELVGALLVPPLVAGWMAVRAAARALDDGLWRLQDALRASAALWRALVVGVEWALDVVLTRAGAGLLAMSRALGWSLRAALVVLRAAGRGAVATIRGVYSTVETVLRLLDATSAWLDNLGRTYDQRLDEAAARTERLARTGARELRDLPSLWLRLSRGTVGLLRRISTFVAERARALAERGAGAGGAAAERSSALARQGASRSVAGGRLALAALFGLWRVVEGGLVGRIARLRREREAPAGVRTEPGGVARAIERATGGFSRAVGQAEDTFGRLARASEDLGTSADDVVDRLQNGLVQGAVLLLSALGRGAVAIFGGLRTLIGAAGGRLAPERLGRDATAGAGVLAGFFLGVLRGAGALLDRGSVSLERAGELLRARAEERRVAREQRRAAALETAASSAPIELPVEQVAIAPPDAPPLAELPTPPSLPESASEAALIAAAERVAPLDVDAPPRTELPVEAEGGRLAGLITLLAAALLSVYLGRQFLAVENVADPEEQAAEQLALGETDAALARYEALLGEADRLDQRLSIRWQIASLLLQDSRREEALNQLRAAVSDARGEPDAEAEAWLKLAEGYRSIGGYDGELEACREALRVDGAPSTLYARALVSIIEVNRRQGDASVGDAEVAAWLQAQDNASAVLSIRAEMADLLVASGDYDRALAGLQSVASLRLDRDQQAQLFAEIASVHEARGALREALAVYESLIRDYPKHLGADGQVLLSAASVAWKLGFEDKATSWLDRIAEREAAPRVRAQATLLRARLERDAGRPNTAALLYRQVLQEHPDDQESTAAAQLALAETLWAVDDPESAERMYEELTRSGDAELVSQVRVGRGRIYQRRGELDAARASYEAVLSEYPDSPAALAAQAGLAELEIEAGNYNEAITALRELRARGQGGLEVDAAIADALLRAGRMDEAELAYTTLTTDAAAGSEAALIGALGLARLAEINGNPEEARAGYERVVAESPDPVIGGQALEALANFYLDQGREDEAMVAYRDFLRTLPEGHAAIFDARLAMAQILRRRGELDLAREHYAALLNESSTPARAAEVRVALAELEESRGDFAAAREAYTRLLAEESLPSAHRDDVVVGLVRTTLAAGEAVQALELARSWSGRTLEASSGDVLLDLEVQALRALGRGEEADTLSGVTPEAEDPLSIGLAEASALVNQGRFDEALARYEALTALAEDDPSAASIALSIAQTLGTAGRLDEARVYYQRVADRYPEEAEARFTAAMGLAWLDRLEGRTSAAIAHYERLRGPDTDSEVWRLQQLAEAWIEAGDPGQAEVVFKQLIRAYPAHPGAQAVGRSGLASLLRSRGDLQSARALYEQVMRQAPEPRDRAKARLEVAMILIDEGRPDAAREALEATLEQSDDPEINLQVRIGLSAVYLEQSSPRQALRVLDDVDASALGAGWEATLLQQQTACLVEMGESAEAERRWRALMARYPDDAELSARARLALGDLAYGRDAWSEAIAAYDAVLDSSSDRFYQARAMLGKGQALTALGREQEAERTYADLMEAFPEQGELVAIARAALDG